jgi:hypothetical protein
VRLTDDTAELIITEISRRPIKSNILGIILEGNCIINWFSYNFVPYSSVSYLMFHMCTHMHIHTCKTYIFYVT